MPWDTKVSPHSTMIPKKLIPPFFIFGILTILHIFEIIEFSTPIIIGMILFWVCTVSFDLYTTFQRKELLQIETNYIISYLLEKTSIKKSIILFIGFEVTCIIFLPMIYFWQIDFIHSGIFAIFAGSIHVIAGISNYMMIADFDNTNLTL